MDDILTIVSKELKEYLMARGSVRLRLLAFLPILLIFGVVLPLQQRDAWTQGPLAGVFPIVLPFILTGGAVADSFAGERERHTLETLLATRLSDRDIFLGKVLAAVLYSLSLVWACTLLSLFTLNITKGSQPFFIYGGSVLIAIVIGSILSSVLIAGIGVLVSLRAPTVRAAAQIFSLVTLVLFVGGPLVLQALPNSAKASILQTFSSTNVAVIGVIASAIVLVIDVVLLAIGIARFQRTRLILE